MSSYAASSTLGSVLNSQNAAEASTFAKDTASQIQTSMSEGDWSLKFLALLGGLAMMVVSALGFVGNILMLRWLSAIFQVYTFVLGVIIVVLESGKRLSFFTRLESSLYRNALFLKFVWGRGIILFVAGSLQVTQRDLVDLIVGCYVCLVGILYILVGRRAQQKLGELRRASPEQLQEEFAKADVDGTGSLTLDQFRQLTSALGLDMNRREVEAAFLQLDYSHIGRLTYESIQMWWSQEATVEQPMYNAQVA